MPHRAALNALVEIVLQDADRRSRRAEDQALNEGRRRVTDAEDHVRELSDAALSLGRVRGEAARDAAQQAAEREVAELRSSAFEHLYDRFTRRLSLALQSLPESLPDGGDYESALRHWGAEAAAIDGPTEVFAAKRDRLAVYEALLDAGATDFSVHVDRLCKAGFVVRDLDGRVVLDRRPDALIGEHEGALRALLVDNIPAFA